jgi:hypothetical protein
MNKDAQVTGNIGLYWTCYLLSRMGWNAMPTARNARGVDIIAYNHDCSRRISIQVKTLSKKNPVPLGTSLNKIMGDFWVIVNNVTTSPVAYVLLPSEVKKLAHRGEKRRASILLAATVVVLHRRIPRSVEQNRWTRMRRQIGSCWL